MVDSEKQLSTLAQVLLNPTSTEHSKLMLYIVYETLKANTRLTLNQLKHLLYGELLISPSLVDGAVGVLASKAMYNCINMYQIKMSKPELMPNFQLEPRDSDVFKSWQDEVVAAHPEFLSFVPPIYARRTRNHQ